MLGNKSLNMVEVCHALPTILYSQLGISFNARLVVVAFANVGASGGVCVAFVTVILKSLIKLVPAAVPSAMVARMVAVPAIVAWNVVPIMVAPVPPSFCISQTIFWFVALLGITVPESARDISTMVVVGNSVISVTAINPTLKWATNEIFSEAEKE